MKMKQIEKHAILFEPLLLTFVVMFSIVVASASASGIPCKTEFDCNGLICANGECQQLTAPGIDSH